MKSFEAFLIESQEYKNAVERIKALSLKEKDKERKKEILTAMNKHVSDSRFREVIQGINSQLKKGQGISPQQWNTLEKMVNKKENTIRNKKNIERQMEESRKWILNYERGMRNDFRDLVYDLARGKKASQKTAKKFRKYKELHFSTALKQAKQYYQSVIELFGRGMLPRGKHLEEWLDLMMKLHLEIEPDLNKKYDELKLLQNQLPLNSKKDDDDRDKSKRDYDDDDNDNDKKSKKERDE